MEDGNATRPSELRRESRLLIPPVPGIGLPRRSSRYLFNAFNIFRDRFPTGELARYESTLAGCAERIVSMAEEQAAHRRRSEARMIAEKLAAERRGQVFAFILVLVSIIVGGALIAFDKDISGLTAILGALVSVVAIFVYGRRKDAEERREKRSEFASPQLRLPYDETASEPDASSRAIDRGAPG